MFIAQVQKTKLLAEQQRERPDRTWCSGEPVVDLDAVQMERPRQPAGFADTALLRWPSQTHRWCHD